MMIAEFAVASIYRNPDLIMPGKESIRGMKINYTIEFAGGASCHT
jgi:hypothetical protein